VVSIPLAGTKPVYVVAALVSVLLLGFFATIIYLLTRGEDMAARVLQAATRPIPGLQGDKVEAVVTRVGLGEADAGIVYVSDLSRPRVPSAKIGIMISRQNLRRSNLASPLSAFSFLSFGSLFSALSILSIGSTGSPPADRLERAPAVGRKGYVVSGLARPAVIATHGHPVLCVPERQREDAGRGASARYRRIRHGPRSPAVARTKDSRHTAAARAESATDRP